jgi:hypothetical protein
VFLLKNVRFANLLLLLATAGSRGVGILIAPLAAPLPLMCHLPALVLSIQVCAAAVLTTAAACGAVLRSF